jgi:hypothetical protein
MKAPLRVYATQTRTCSACHRTYERALVGAISLYCPECRAKRKHRPAPEPPKVTLGPKVSYETCGRDCRHYTGGSCPERKMRVPGWSPVGGCSFFEGVRG